MKKSIPVAFLVVIAATAAAGGELYKCRSPEGRYTYQNAPCDQKNNSLPGWSPPRFNAAPANTNVAPNVASNGTLAIPARPGGGYYVQGTVNNVPVTFQIDTGADLVAIPAAIAEQAGLVCRQTSMARTANGVTTQCAAEAAAITFGPFRLDHYATAILPNLHMPLLGMNALREFHIEQKDGIMKITR